ncbi:MAG: DMT family transporter [Burkholderiales bacterium]|nr:DMT family transporter [Burkholderiales bacterium]
MIWFFIAIIGPFLYALTNHIDKLLLEKYFKVDGIGTLVLFSSLLSALALPFLFLADMTVFSISFTNMLALAIVGILNALVLLCYLVALKNDEASVTVIFYQLVPVIGGILGYFFLGEVLNNMQILSMATIILGTTIISFEIDVENKFKIRKKVILPMLAAASFWAIGSVIFKAVALEEDVWKSLFYEHLMLVVIGIFIFIFMRSHRVKFLAAIKNNSKAILSLNVLNESLFMLGNIIVAYAYMLAPLGLVLLTESFQPIFVLVIGVFLTIFFPRITKEKIQAKHIIQKVIAILITGVGTYLLFIS